MQRNNTGKFTPADLQHILCEELKDLLKDINLKKTNGEYTSANVYCQELPIPRETDDEDDLDNIPYIIVRVMSGRNLSNSLSIEFAVIIAVYDDDQERNGHFDVLNIISRIENHFGRKPCLGNFRIQDDFEFALQDADTHPFYFGGVKLSFYAPKTRQEDDFYT